MFENMQLVTLKVLMLFILLAIGAVTRLTGIVKEEGARSICSLIIYVVTPANIISAFSTPFREDLLHGLLISFLLAFIVFFLMSVISRFLIREKDPDKSPVLRFAAAYPNAGYMGIPLQRAVLGDIGVFYCAAYIAVFHMFVWSYGVAILSHKQKSGASSRAEILRILKKCLLSPPLIAVVVGLVIFLFNIELPEIVASPLSELATMATPLPMLITGYYLAGGKLALILKNKWILVAAALKMIVSPALAIGACLVFAVSHDASISCLIACAASSASMTTMLAAEYHRDSELAASVVTFTTLLAILTMPFFVALVGSIT
ncbi:MAG: AEC family transporter [Lachnospiraceae bacterium]|nr:AEC family transporter [Lachnospiraceae bacterium]